MKRVRSLCNGCLSEILCPKWHTDEGQARCALCSCFTDGTLTIEEAIRDTSKERGISLMDAAVLTAKWISGESIVRKLNFPFGYQDKK